MCSVNYAHEHSKAAFTSETATATAISRKASAMAQSRTYAQAVFGASLRHPSFTHFRSHVPTRTSHIIQPTTGAPVVFCV